MSIKTYKEIEVELEAMEQANKEHIQSIEKQKREFIRGSLFTGKELLQMRNDLKSDRDHSEPWLNYVLEQILQNRD